MCYNVPDLNKEYSGPIELLKTQGSSDCNLKTVLPPEDHPYIQVRLKFMAAKGQNNICKLLPCSFIFGPKTPKFGCTITENVFPTCYDFELSALMSIWSLVLSLDQAIANATQHWVMFNILKATCPQM